MSQVTPCQNVPVQTSQYNFPTCQQRQTSTQQMQTAACGPCSGISQGPCTHVYQPDTYVVTHQHTLGSQPVTNPCYPVFQSSCNPPSLVHPSCAQLPQNILDQIRACVSNAAPIFILPSNCQQSPMPQQQQQQQQPQQLPFAPTSPQAMMSPPTTAYPPSGLTYPAACYPPPFYPYPVPLPFCDPFIRARETMQNCGCCRRRDVIDPLSEARNIARVSCRYDIEQDEHRCTPTTDDTICAKRNCPASLHLQALASQFLSMQGIIACAATRLVLRKVPGSNVTTTMEETMAKAQKAINILTKDQLLSESRNAQQVNALINLHMTANPPPNIIPILTLIQLKVNLLKAQVEGLVNQRLMEIQGVGVEVETDLIDSAVLAMKSNAELRDFLSILRQKECDERVNVNFAPYRSQRAIAETRLSNIQNKIRQVEAEFDRRRCAMLPAPTLTSRIVQQFAAPCYSARFEDPRKLYSTLPSRPSSDPFTAKPRSPKRLLLKPYVGNPETATQAADAVPGSSTSANRKSKDDSASSAKEPPAASERPSSAKDCACDRTTSEESISEAKKKLQPRIVEIDATVSNIEEVLHEASLMKLMSDVCVRIGARKCQRSARKWNETLDVDTPWESDRECWTAKAYVNVADDESTKTSMESESDTITFSEKIGAVDVCESRDTIVIRSYDQIMKFANSTNLRESEKEEEAESAILKNEEAIKEHDIRTRSSQDISSSKADERGEMEATAAAEVAEDGPIAKVRETEQKSPDDVCISSLQVALKPKKEKRGDEQKDTDGEILPSSTNEKVERSANAALISKSKKKTRFHILSLLINIVYDKDREHQRKRRLDENAATSGRETSVITDSNIEKSHKYSSMDNLLRSAVTHAITEEDHSKDIFPERLNLSTFYIDRQCQTMFRVVEENKETSSTLLRASVFPPFKKLHKHVADNERNGDNVGAYISPITKARITTAKHLSHCNDVTENTSRTLCENNIPYLSEVKREESFLSVIFSLIGNRVTTFVNKIIDLNRKLLHLSRGTILRKRLNADISRKVAPLCDQSELILKNYGPFADTVCYPPDSIQEISRTDKHDVYDANLLRVSTGEESDKIYKIKHSIIENRKAGTKYLLIDTSNHNYDPIVVRDFGHPYKVEKSLLIRSRLKNSQNMQNQPYPFSIVKRIGKNIFESHNESIEIVENEKVHELKDAGNSTRSKPELKDREQFWILSKVKETSKNNNKKSKSIQHDNEFAMKNSEQCNDDFKKCVSYEHSHDIKSNIFTKQNHTASNELIINVYDYLGLQTEINTKCTNIHKNSAYLLISNNR